MVGNMIRVLRARMTLLAVDEAGMSTVEDSIVENYTNAGSARTKTWRENRRVQRRTAAVTLHHRRTAVGEVGHDLAQPLRTHRRGDVHRMNNIGEQDGDLLVLSGFRRCRHRCAALRTELRILRQLDTA